MREQLARLLELSALQHISVRVVPKSVGWHHGLEGSFKVMTVGASDVVYTEATGGGRLALGAPDVEAFAIRYDKIGVKALPEDSSRRARGHGGLARPATSYGDVARGAPVGRPGDHSPRAMERQPGEHP